MRRVSLFVHSALLLTFLTSCTPEESGGPDAASQEAAKELVRHWIVSMWDRGDRDLFDELATEDYVYSVPGQEDLSGDAFFAYGDAIRAAIPDLNNTFEEQFVDGDTVVTRGTTRGTHQGSFGDFPATGNAIEVPWVMITRLKDGRVSAEWEIFDTLAFMTQLEAVSIPSEQE